MADNNEGYNHEREDEVSSSAHTHEAINSNILKTALDVEYASSTDTIEETSAAINIDQSTNDNDCRSSPAAFPPAHETAVPPKNSHEEQLEKLSRHIPPSLDLHYITPQLIGMAPPRPKYPHLDSEMSPPYSVQKTSQTSRNKKCHENDPAELSSFLERRHSKRYLLFNVSDEDVDDRSLLLLGRQVVHLPWGSPRITPNTLHRDPNRASLTSLDHISHSFERSNSQECPVSPTPSVKASGSSEQNAKHKSSQTPAVQRVMEICYAIHAYLTTNSSKGKKSTIACIYCSNGKTRTGVIIACYLRFCNEVTDALSGFELFCHRRGISPNKDKHMSGHIPPSLGQFFKNFNELVMRKRYPFPEPLLLQCVKLQGVPVDDMPCIDIWEHGDVVRHQVYSSHDDVALNEWHDDEGSYNIGQILNRDFTLVCRFGGKFLQGVNDPTKVLFRYVNSTKFLNDGELELGMESVDIMRWYADSFHEEDFSLTLEFESIGDEDGNHEEQKRMFIANGLASDAVKIVDQVFEGIDSVLCGWQVISESHLSHFSVVDANDLQLDPSSFTMKFLDSYLDFRHIALQLTNGDVELAREELAHGLFRTFFTPSEDKDNEYCSNIVDAKSENILSLNDSFAISERQRACIHESYFTANDDEIDEESSYEHSTENNSLEDDPRPVPRSPEEYEATFSDPELIVFDGDTDDIEEKKITAELDITADQSINDTFKHTERNTTPPANDIDETVSQPNTPFADHSRSSLLEALKLRELGKSMVSPLGIDKMRSSLLREITETARKRNQKLNGYKDDVHLLPFAEPLPNLSDDFEKYSAPIGDAQMSQKSDSSIFFTGQEKRDGVVSVSSVIHPGENLNLYFSHDETSHIEINQPMLHDTNDVDERYVKGYEMQQNCAISCCTSNTPPLKSKTLGSDGCVVDVNTKLTMINIRSTNPALKELCSHDKHRGKKENAKGKTNTQRNENSPDHDSKAALNAMFAKRSEVTIPTDEKDQAELEPEPEPEPEADPRAALNAMFAKRSEASVSRDEKDQPQIEADPRAAPKGELKHDLQNVTTPEGVAPQDDPLYQKYFKMLKMVRTLLFSC